MWGARLQKQHFPLLSQKDHRWSSLRRTTYDLPPRAPIVPNDTQASPCDPQVPQSYSKVIFRPPPITNFFSHTPRGELYLQTISRAQTCISAHRPAVRAI